MDLNEGLESEWMEFSNYSKWLSNPWHRHQEYVCLIVKDILFRNIDTFLQEVFRKRGEMKQIPWKGAKIRTPNQQSHPTQEGLQHNRDNIWYKKLGKWMQRREKQNGSTYLQGWVFQTHKWERIDNCLFHTNPKIVAF
jgi:hypothetical protein